MSKYPLYALMFFSSSAISAIYKSVDENGNTIYSDTPNPGGESVELAPMTTYKAPKYSPFPFGLDKTIEGASEYKSLRITSPQADQSFWETTGAIKIIAEVDPELQYEFGHHFQFYMDGYKQGKASEAPSISLVGLNRGEHSVYVQILDDKGKVVQRSQSVIFTLHKPSVNQPGFRPVNPPVPVPVPPPPVNPSQ